MRIAFTGTREGMTDKQKEVFISLLKRLPTITEFRHGACEGSDMKSHWTIRDFYPNTNMHIHPSDFVKKDILKMLKGEAETLEKLETGGKIIIHDEKPPLERNHDMVDAVASDEESCGLIATPAGEEIIRSGTWATIRYAKNQSPKTGIVIYVIYPDGQLVKTDFGPTKCPKCHSTNYEQSPIDETMGIYPFLDCIDCGNRWWSD